MRSARLLAFQKTVSSVDVQPCVSLRWDAAPEGPARFIRWDALSLEGSAYTVVDGGRAVLLTHVLRDSPAGMRWRNGSGECARLNPGALFVAQGPRDFLVETRPYFVGQRCDCVRIALGSDFTEEMAFLVEPADFSVCDCSDACFRVMLGRFRCHQAFGAPVTGLSMLDVELAPFADIEVGVAADHWALAVVTAGSLQVGERIVEPWAALAFNGCEPLVRLATQSGASLLWFDMPYALRRAHPSSARSADRLLRR